MNQESVQLGYARAGLRRSRNSKGLVVLVPVVLGVLCLLVLWRDRPAASKAPPADPGNLISAGVPGTEVYLRERKLGVVPLRLTGDELKQLGLIPRQDQHYAILPDIDGEGWYVGDRFAPQPKIMLKVPDAVASQYLAVETPWGRRTFATGGNLKAAARSDGLSLAVAVPATIVRKQGTVSVTVTLSNNSLNTLHGFRPTVQFCLGSFNTPPDLRTRYSFPAPTEWASIGADRQLEAKFDVPVPVVADDYRLQGSLNVFKQETGDLLLERGSLYAPSVLLQVR